MDNTVASDKSFISKPSAVPFGQALLYWLKLGFISFGGPAGQISMMHQELVVNRRWISEHRFLHALNFTMVLPGPEAQQLATYIGWLMHGSRGGILAGSLFVLPSLVLLIGLTWLYLVHGEVAVVAGILYGIKPAVTAIVVFAAYRIGSRALKNNIQWFIAALSFIAIFALGVPFPYIVIGAGLLGYLGGHYLPNTFLSVESAQAPEKSFGPALIDDHTPLPQHVFFKWWRLWCVIGVGLALWAGAMALLISVYGSEGTLTHMGWFFTKAALVTFGGAYAVLPYIYQGGVDQFQWLSAHQMIDGLALGETTPGPLIMIVSYVGFVGGWTKEIFGIDHLVLSGVAGAVVATFFTFLPSFLFIMVFGPAVEASRHDIKLTAPLKGITAAVVGVILNLALFFAWHVWWPQATPEALFSGQFEWMAVLITVIAFIALWRFKLGIIPVLGLCAALGLGYHFILS